MKVIVTDEVSEAGLDTLRADARIDVDVRLGLSVEELHAVIGDYDAIITRSGTTMDAAVLEHAKNLKIVARAGVGIDNVDVDAASSKGIIVVNAPLGNTNSAAEHTMALLLSLCRNIPVANDSLKAGPGNVLLLPGMSSSTAPWGLSASVRWVGAWPCAPRHLRWM